MIIKIKFRSLKNPILFLHKNRLSLETVDIYNKQATHRCLPRIDKVQMLLYLIE